MTHYEVLGVDRAAPAAELRQAYVEQARRHHPDRGGDPASMRAVNEAWAALSDPGRRALYDLSLAAPVRRADVRAPEPPAQRVTSEEEDLLADLADDHPIGGTVRLPRWLALLPVATFALSILLGFFGIFFVAPPLVVSSVVAFLVSCTLFLVSPFIALYASQRANR